MLCLKIAGRVANSVDPDEMPHSAASHLGLHCLLRPFCPNAYGKCGTDIFLISPWVPSSYVFMKNKEKYFKCGSTLYPCTIFVLKIWTVSLSYLSKKKCLAGQVVSPSNFGSWGLGFESHWRQNSIHDYGTSLHRAFHYHPFVISIWLQ